MIFGYFFTIFGAYFDFPNILHEFNIQLPVIPKWIWILSSYLLLIIIPFISFHKLRVERDKLKDINKNPSLTISYESHQWDVKERLVRISANFYPTRPMQVARLELSFPSDKFKKSVAISFLPTDIDKSTTITGRFKVNISIPAGTYQAQLKVLAAGEWWLSNLFPLDISENKIIIGY